VSAGDDGTTASDGRYAPGEPLRDRAELAELGKQPGLCATCVHARLLRSPRSTFLRCAKSDVDKTFPRYPRLPVVACGGHLVAARLAPPSPALTTAPELDARSTILHVTNGDAVLPSFRESGLDGDVLPWRDVLHDGPLPTTDTLEELSEVRARTLAAFGWGSYPELRIAFARRDAALYLSREREEVVLWFEHDLYDQLQLLQLLDWFARNGRGRARLSLVTLDAFPGVEPFHGLGQLRGGQLRELWPARRAVTMRQLATASAAWRDVRAATPGAMAARAAGRARVHTTANHIQDEDLPFLAAALRRFCEEYPWTRDGLSRNERQILAAAASGAETPAAIHRATSAMESSPWGDASVFQRIEGLARTTTPALARRGSKAYELTALGRRLLAGEADWVVESGGLDRWVGGVHLAGATAAWRWDERTETLVAAPSG
jgi:hypothetical protein